MGLNDKAWETLLERLDILSGIRRTGFYEIDAKTIKTVREPRLMAKFDHKSNLPDVFRKNGLSILPISRFRYIIGEFEAYQTISYNTHLTPTSISFPSYISSIDPTNLYSESVALHCAYASGMIEDLIGEMSMPTISGRMSSNNFDFLISSKGNSEQSISISKSQIEIDAGYESENRLILVEAKQETITDFLIRQLYYPYRLWLNQVHKEVIPVFFTHSNDVFSFFVYEFVNITRYNSLRLVYQKDYVIAHEDIELNDILEIASSVSTVAEPEVPFPQADNFVRIIDLLGLLVENNLEKDEITSNYNFDARQTNYYTTAGMYLGLIERYINADHVVVFRLTPKGRNIMRKHFKAKYLSLASCILEHNVFKQVFSEYIQNGYPPDRNRVVDIMKACNLYHVGTDSTYFRRSQTILKWLQWILDLQNT